MHWLNCFLQVIPPTSKAIPASPTFQLTAPPDPWAWVKNGAAVLSALAALANLGLALVIYRYTRQKNGQWTEQQRIDSINFVKTQERNLRRAVVEVLGAVAPAVYGEVDKIIVGLTDALTRAIGNDEHKLEHPKTFERLIYEPINNAKAEVVKALFRYSG